jgi:hypothetical protein
MGKLIVFLILAFMAYAVLKQMLKVVRFFEPKPQREMQPTERQTVDVAARDVTGPNADGTPDWADEVKRAYDLFKTGALSQEEFEQVKVQLLARAGIAG